MLSKSPPIGYWIRQADELLTTGISEIQSSFGLTRTGWQVLNTMFEKERTGQEELASILSPFSDAASLEQVLIRFKEEGFLSEEGSLALTAKGIDLHRACLEKQHAFRQKVMAGISEQQYQQTIMTLQAMVENMKK